VLLFVFALVGIPNLRDRSEWILPYLTFGIPFVLFPLGLVLLQLSRMEAPLQSKVPQRPQ